MPFPPSKSEQLLIDRSKNPLFKKYVIAGREWRGASREDMHPSEIAEQNRSRYEYRAQQRAAADRIREGARQVATRRAFSPPRSGFGTGGAIASVLPAVISALRGKSPIDAGPAPVKVNGKIQFGGSSGSRWD